MSKKLELELVNDDGHLVKRVFKRSFGGIFPPENNYDKKHLKGYLKGDHRFSYGRDSEGYPIWFRVETKWAVEEIILKENVAPKVTEINKE